MIGNERGFPKLKRRRYGPGRTPPLAVVTAEMGPSPSANDPLSVGFPPLCLVAGSEPADRAGGRHTTPNGHIRLVTHMDPRRRLFST